MATVPDFDRVCVLIAEASLSSAQTRQLYELTRTAAIVVDARVPSASCMTAAIRQMIAEHLAAHWWDLGGGQMVASERLLDYSVSYATASLSDVGSTRNGRIAVELDCTGTLAELTKPRPTFAVLDQNQ